MAPALGAGKTGVQIPLSRQHNSLFCSLIILLPMSLASFAAIRNLIDYAHTCEKYINDSHKDHLVRTSRYNKLFNRFGATTVSSPLQLSSNATAYSIADIKANELVMADLGKLWKDALQGIAPIIGMTSRSCAFNTHAATIVIPKWEILVSRGDQQYAYQHMHDMGSTGRGWIDAHKTAEQWLKTNDASVLTALNAEYIILVDDSVKSGTSLAIVESIVKQVLPKVKIECFALINEHRSTYYY
jgi:hypothetical protein